MQGKRLALTLLGFAIFLCSNFSYAIMSVPYGWYLEANIGLAKMHDVSYPGTNSTNNIGANANLGYKFMPFFASEIGYSQYGNTTIKDPATTNAGTAKHFAWDFAFKGIVPFTDSGFEAFAKIGLVWITSSVTITNSAAANNIGLNSSRNSNTNGYIGIGGQYYFMPEMAAVIQWNHAKGNNLTGSFDLLSLGISFIFD